MTHAGGRPTKYTPNMVKQAAYYLDHFNDEDIGDEIPSVAGLADYLSISRDTVYEWAKDEGKAEFSDILVNILSRQEKVLINKGLNNQFNSNITKLVLGKHGYHDKQDTHVKEFHVTIGGKDAESL